MPHFFDDPVEADSEVITREVDFDEEESLTNGYKLLTAEDVNRAKTVFESLATQINPKDPAKYMKKDQFVIAVSLLGVNKSESEVHDLFDGTGDDYEEIGIAQGLDLLTLADFVIRINASRSVNINPSQRDQVPSWFQTMYEMMCEDDDQKTDNGSRYLLVRQFREILQDYGHRISSEEANAIIRSCRPIKDPLSEFDEGMGRIFFGQYQSMLLDEGV